MGPGEALGLGGGGRGEGRAAEGGLPIPLGLQQHPFHESLQRVLEEQEEGEGQPLLTGEGRRCGAALHWSTPPPAVVPTR